MTNFDSNPAVILLVEDNEGDARLAVEALHDGKVANDIRHVRDGVEAMAFLRREGEYADAPRPHVILLDLNMPRKDGREVLEDLAADRDLCKIPVVVLTTSQSETDIVKSYELHANCYITKPVDFEQFAEAIQSIETFWFNVVSLPAA